MKRILLAAATPAALVLNGGCIDNDNQVGTLDVGGSGGTVVVVGGRAGGTENGGAGAAPGSMGGRVGVGPPLVAQCTPTGARLTLARDCSKAEDCVAVAQTKTVLLSNEPAPECDVLYFGIGVEQEAALEAFKLDCASVASCPPNQTRVVTQDGQSGPVLSSTPLATCQNSVCQSYLP